jgi:pimeloyl-ACP methyl ester carboxylesterase
MKTDHLEIKLSDGRTLAYAESGHPDGKPVFFFHGTPGSRFFRPPDKVTRQLGVRLITLDRPGYGRSTFQPGRRFLDWPKDIVQLADALGIERFAVAGHSGGGPYVLACAFALPERVTAAASLSGAGPLDTPGATDGMTTLNKLGFRFGRFLPWPLWRLLMWLTYHRRSLDPAAAMDRETGRRPAADDVQIARPEVRAACLESEKEAFRGGLRALAWDARLLTGPWGFHPEEIRIPVHFWHGTADNLTTAAMARSLASRIPGSRVTICEGEAHLLLFPHWHEILTQLITE